MIKAEKIPTLCFEEPGRECTDETLAAAAKYAEDHKINNIVVASTYGDTALKALETFKERNLVVVTHSTGFVEPGIQQMPQDVIEKIRREGAEVLTTTHALAGVDRAIRKAYKTWQPVELIAQSLKLFGDGTKVAIEITVMAADAGLIPIDEEAIAIGGTDRGADTALHIKPAHSSNFFDTRIKWVICKPANI